MSPEYYWNRMCLECWGRYIASETLADRSVPRHPPPLQGSDNPALLAIWDGVEFCKLSEDTLVDQFFRQNMSTSTLQTDSILSTLHIFLHINDKPHSPQTVPSEPPSVQILKHRQKRALSYFTFESISFYCCMYHHCCSTIVLFSIVPCSI